MAKQQDAHIANTEQSHRREDGTMSRQQDVLVTGTDIHVSKNVVHEQAVQQKPLEQELKEMPSYTANRSVRAMKLKAVDRNDGGTVTLIPEDSAHASFQLGGKQAEAIPGWRSDTPNSDPGYGVLDDNGNRCWMSTQEFEGLYGAPKAQSK